MPVAAISNPYRIAPVAPSAPRWAEFVPGMPHPQSYWGKILRSGPIAYWVQGEAPAVPLPAARCEILSPGQDGTYNSVALGQPGIGDGHTAAGYDGATSYLNILTAAFIGRFNGQAGSFLQWMMTSAWADGIRRDQAFIQVDAANFIIVRKDPAANQMSWLYNAGGVLDGVVIGGLADIIWVPIGLTWDLNAGATGELRAFYNGAQVGATQVGLGTWVGALTNAVLGATNVAPANVHDGNLGNSIIWDRAITPAEMLDYSTV